MINSYLVDRINIINTTYDEWGTKTESTQTNVKCKIEEQNKVVRNGNGQEQTSDTLIMLPKTANIDYQSRIKIVSRGGIAQTNDRKYSIIKIGLQGGFVASHYEVFL